MWEKGIERGTSFDKNCPQPALMELLKKGEIPFGRALVPGFGRGYDIVALACPERFVVGIEIADAAIVEARKYVNELDIKASDSWFEFRLGSFFDLDESVQFDFVYGENHTPPKDYITCVQPKDY